MYKGKCCKHNCTKANAASIIALCVLSNKDTAIVAMRVLCTKVNAANIIALCVLSKDTAIVAMRVLCTKANASIKRKHHKARNAQCAFV